MKYLNKSLTVPQPSTGVACRCPQRAVASYRRLYLERFFFAAVDMRGLWALSDKAGARTLFFSFPALNQKKHNQPQNPLKNGTSKRWY